MCIIKNLVLTHYVHALHIQKTLDLKSSNKIYAMENEWKKANR